MTALDQAFIKAYTERRDATAVVRKEDPQVSLPHGEAAAEPTIRLAAGTVEEPPPRALRGSPRGPADAKPSKAERKAPRARRARAADKPVEPGAASPNRRHSRASRRASAPAAAAPLSVDDLGLSGGLPPSQEPSPPAGSAEPRAHAAPSVAAAAPAADQPAEAAFRPALEVECLAWPAGCDALHAAAPGAIDQVAEGLAAAVAAGHKVLGVAAARQGEGCTTLLLSAARCLAAHGWKVLLADADVQNPVLARRLGLLPEAGWDDVLAGRLPMAEAVIESVRDRLALLPWRGTATAEGRGPASVRRLAESLEPLRRHYDLVLVDLGRWAEPLSSSGDPGQSAQPWIDAVLLVHHVQATPQAELSQVRERVRACGIAEAGVVENFV